MTSFYINDLLFSISYALDFVEGALVGVSAHHSKRVACVAARMGKSAGMTDAELFRLSAAAALHDNGLSEYVRRDLGGQMSGLVPADFGKHCIYGERNAAELPFFGDARNLVLYHHEAADGSGPFGRTARETPLAAQLVHLADAVDARCDLSELTDMEFEMLRAWLRTETGTQFDAECVRLFLDAFPDTEALRLETRGLDKALHALVPDMRVDYAPEQLIKSATIFARIIDNKSHFTCTHSMGIAEKAREMGAFYGESADAQAQLYLAGAVHDLGKLMIRSDVLEKPGRLTAEEYSHIQDHAWGSYLALHEIRGLEPVMAWAYLHHEKLNGSGYPFGRHADALNRNERLMACLDIYQALVEDRPYKAGMAHTDAMRILQKMVADGQLDPAITEDINRCFGKAGSGAA